MILKTAVIGSEKIEKEPSEMIEEIISVFLSARISKMPI